jgi:pyrroloquinoline quinone biosynthesis protein E
MEHEWTLTGMNIELTTCCPLRCPQCYCTLEGGKHIPLEKALAALDEGAALGVQSVQLSGGETMCYPHLVEVIAHARKKGIEPDIAISGWHFDATALERLMSAGVDGIFVSINAPTEEMNRLSRDGFDLAIQALNTLKKANYPKTYINWVMHRETAHTLPQMYQLALDYGVKHLVILVPKPDAQKELLSFPTREQMEEANRFIRARRQEDIIRVEACFSQLLAMLGKNAFWTNLNRGLHKGCGAGLSSISVSVEGQFSPCRHLEEYETFPSLQDYWQQSKVLSHIRGLEKYEESLCTACEYGNYCRHCLAINSKLHGKIALGNNHCPIGVP